MCFFLLFVKIFNGILNEWKILELAMLHDSLEPIKINIVLHCDCLPLSINDVKL